MTRRDRLYPDDRTTLTAILQACPALARLAGHVTRFTTMMTQLKGDRLLDWIADVEADNLSALTPFASHLHNDLAAVTNGLTLPYSSGAVEGTVNKIKTLKRAMHGRSQP
jgi:transposase